MQKHMEHRWGPCPFSDQRISIICTGFNSPSRLHCRYQNVRKIQIQCKFYGLDGPGIELGQGRDFPYPSRQPLRPTQPPIQWVPCLSRGHSGRGVALTIHPYLSLRLKKEQSYTSTPPLGLHDLYQDELTFTNTDSFLRQHANGLSVLGMMIFLDMDLHCTQKYRRPQVQGCENVETSFNY